MPDSYGVPLERPIVSAANAKALAPDWAGLLDGAIDVSLKAAQLLGPSRTPASAWGSGTDPGGSSGRKAAAGGQPA